MLDIESYPSFFFPVGSTLRYWDIGHKYHFCPPLLKKSHGYAPHSSPTDLIQLVRTARSSEIHAFCWKTRHLLRFTEAAEICTVCWFPWQLPRIALAAGCWAGCWGPHQLLRATHASSLFLAVPRHSSYAKFLNTLGEARREKISQAAFQKAGYVGCTFHCLFCLQEKSLENGIFSWCLTLPTWRRGNHR